MFALQRVLFVISEDSRKEHTNMKPQNTVFIPDEAANSSKVRIIQELVPGKQITLAHIIASPDQTGS